ncbi:hypothetical protein BCR36DRAFT_581968 [Piromyces finnis]|uniref:N-acetyltransferase domain-containing protein n=1 Tax=Piromyces finnis TaxID=1754191 RepID=A0A1Y1VET7_9FUNG|nr:hypothetical protein BCR36DRAFT_581968 [Piromyces finnis]|eukprot:ORX54337.1 hypothetical protein BCR36DRAFT_581968 [Piromyces finnis]
MQLIKVNDIKEEHDRILKLYYEAFPANERIPYWALKIRARQGKSEMFNIFDDNNTWVGWVYIMVYKDLAYILFFAIDKENRGKGNGTEALALILEKYKNYRIYFCLEDWTEEGGDVEQKIRRHNFYKRCGMNDLPYKTNGRNVTFCLMYKGGYIPPEEFQEMMYDFAGFPVKYFINIKIFDK